MDRKWILATIVALSLLAAMVAVALSWSVVDPFTGAGPDFMISLPLDHQADPSVAYNPDADQYLVVWWDDRNTATTDTDIYGQIFSASGVPQGDNFVVSNASGEQSYPYIAYNSTDHNYMVVWRDKRGGPNYDVYGQVISATGTPSGINFAINTDAGGQRPRDLIYDPNANHYLLVWVDDGDNRVEGQLLNAAGGLIGTNAFAIAADGDGPRAAYNSNRNSYMVVYYYYEHAAGNRDIHGQAIAGDGSLSGSAFVICDNAADQTYPNLEFNSTTHEYLVVWEDRRNSATTGTDFYARRINQDGNPQGDEIVISNADDAQNRPDVAYNARVNQWLVAWEDYRNRDASGVDVYGQRVLSTGSLAGQGNFIIYDGPNNQGSVALAARPTQTGAEYLAVWEDHRSRDGLEVVGQRIGALLGTLNWHDFNVSAPLESQENPQVVYNPNAQQFLVVWQDGRQNEWDIYAQIVLTTGIPITDNIVLADGPSNATHPAVAYNSLDNEYLIAWEDEAILSVYGQLVRAEGGLIGSAFPIFSQTGVRGDPVAAYNSTDNEYLVVFTYGGPGYREVRGARVDADGHLLRSDFPICVETGDRDHISVAHDTVNDKYLVVWQDLRDDQGDVYGRLMDANGDPSAPEFVIAQAADAQAAPAVAWNSDEDKYLVVWHDYRDSGTTGADIYGQRVGADGSLLGSEIVLCTASDHQQYPQVNYISTLLRYSVIWADDRNTTTTGWDIYGQSVNADGSLYGSNVVHFVFSGDQRRPGGDFSPEANRGLIVWQDGRNGTTYKIYGRIREPRFPVYLPLVLKNYP